jgi:hypothetical protein
MDAMLKRALLFSLPGLLCLAGGSTTGSVSVALLGAMLVGMGLGVLVEGYKE